MAQEIIYLGIDEIVPYDRNPRKNDAAVDAVANSIREFGWKNPIIVDKDHVIVSGHTRRLAALKLGIDRVPVLVADDLTDEQIRAFRLADNRVADMAIWDEAKLKEEISGIGSIDLSDMGFDEGMLKDVAIESTGVKLHRCPRCGCEWE